MAARVVSLHKRIENADHAKQSLRLWIRLLSCSTVIEKTVRTRLTAQFATTLPRFDVLAALDRAPDGLSMGDLSAYLLVSNGNTTGIVENLVTDGWVARKTDPMDRRTQFIKITRKGKLAFVRMAAAHEVWIDDMFNDLSSADLKLFLALLDKLKRSISKNLG